MDIPKDNLSKVNYLNRVIDFVRKWKWIYATRPTHILIDNVLDLNHIFLQSVGQISQEILSQIFSGNHIVLDDNGFLFDCKRLTLNIPSFDFPSAKPEPQRKGVTPKKLHEVNRLGFYVSKLIKENYISTVVDIGSGLGYVDRKISSSCPNCTVIAVEADPKKSSKASDLNGENQNIKQMCTKVTEENLHLLSQRFDSNKIGPACIIALHACGDLTVDCFRLLESCGEINHSVIMSCCYHKVSNVNFPLSSQYLNADKEELNELFPTTFLRLASDRTQASFKEWDAVRFNNHVFNNLARAVIELYINKRALRVEKKTRKWANHETTDWDSYLEEWIKKHDVFDCCDNPVNIKPDICSFWSDNFYKFDCMKGLLVLQIIFQSVAESFVVMDRLVYLSFRNYSSNSVVRISDSNISPRSIAYVVHK